MPRKTDRFSAKAEGAGQQASRARSVGRLIDTSLEQNARNVGADAELIFQAHAPRRTGRLARGIRAVAVGDQVVVSAVAIDPKSGFDYVDVTRFGHRKRYIIPVGKSGAARKSRTIARTSTGQFAKRTGGRLVFMSRGRLWRLARVRGFRPKGDWVQRGMPEVQAAADTEMERTGNKIAARWGS